MEQEQNDIHGQESSTSLSVNSSDNRSEIAIRSLPETFYEKRMAELDREYQDKKTAIEIQKTSAEYDSEIIKSTLLGTTKQVCSMVTKNEMKGECLYFWIKQVGRNAVHLTLCEIISCYGSYFRDSKFISDGEIISLADFFIDKYPYSLRFSELIYFMNQGVAGRWGKIYGDLTAAQFFEWWIKYEQELSGTREDEHNERKNITRPVVEKIEDLFKNKFTKWNPNQSARPKSAPDENYFNQNPLAK
jgi:hypothetical protein